MMADFTGWEIVVLERSGNEWRLTQEVPPGLHRIAIRVDGGDWIAPPGLPRATDELGGVVGLITVP
jgi:AMP-activated protein kinase-like protein